MNFIDFLRNNRIYLDGGMGTRLQQMGLCAGELPEKWNITHPEEIKKIHEEYFSAGSTAVLANTFGANSLKFSDSELEKIICAAIENAKAAAKKASTEAEKFIAMDIGPTGKLLKPLGSLDFEEAVEIFAKSARLGEKYGADFIFIETMSDLYEIKAAILAAKENTSLPIMVSAAFSEDGKLMTGASPEAVVALAEGMGAVAVGANCSLGPSALSPIIERMLRVASIPVILKPNAGIPREVGGESVFDISPSEFAEEIAPLVKAGVSVVGGCCGTTSEYIKALIKATKDIEKTEITKKNLTVVSSYTDAVYFGKAPVLIGERINPTGKKKFKEALIRQDMDYILTEASAQEEAGAHILDVNVGIPEIDETKLLTRAVTEIQEIVNLPLQIDTSNAEAMESALRRYNGIALINSVSGKEESMKKIFPLAKKYGGVIIALTLDESGIPKDAEGRVKIAKKILAKAKEYGIDKKDIIFDTLTMAVSAESSAAKVTIEALERIKTELGCHTSLGVSNVSFGLPERDALSSTFFTMALTRGLDAAIMNPYSRDMMRAYYSFLALSSLDENFERYIKNAPNLAIKGDSNAPVQQKTPEEYKSALSEAIIKGYKRRAAEITEELLLSRAALDIVGEEIIPALDEVGKGYETGKTYLPQLLMSAEAAKCAFDAIKKSASENENAHTSGKVLLATVRGDIHDIGKNIVKLLLSNYGFEVIDLGKDVAPEVILEAARGSGARLVGLSALMTTTAPAMKETIELLHKELPNVKIMVGGAVLTEEYAKEIGADKYAPDAMAGVEYAKEIYKKY